MMQSEMKLKDQQRPFKSFVFFVNTQSGSKFGQRFASIKDKITFSLNIQSNSNNKPKHEHMKQFDLYFYQLKAHRDEGFKKIEALIDQNKQVIGVICGGDGTVSWIIQELAKYKIDQQKVPFTIVPLGTGNDFSQALGWGTQNSKHLQEDYKQLKMLIIQWLHAKQDYVDIWEIQAETKPWGKFEKVVNQQTKQVQQKIITRLFVNYAGFGVDGKVGYQFDKHRTSSRLGNLFVYALMGIMKAFSNTKCIYELVQRIITCPQIQPQQDFEVGKIKIKPIGKEIRQSQNLIYQERVQNSFSFEHNVNILALNINSYVWEGQKIFGKTQKTQNKPIMIQNVHIQMENYNFQAFHQILELDYKNQQV